MMDYSKIKERIVTLRKAQDLSQADVADMLGIHTNTYAKLENGDTHMTLAKLDEIACILKTTPEYLFFGYLQKADLGEGGESYEGMNPYIGLSTQQSKTIKSLEKDKETYGKLVKHLEDENARLTENLNRAIEEKSKLEEELAALKGNQ